MSATAPSIWRERLASPLTWHFAGCGVLLILAAVLGSRFAMDWAATSDRSTDALAGKQTELKLLELQTAPMRGLDKRVATTKDEIKDFYAKRIPASYSAIETRIDELQVNSSVRLSRLQYTQGKPGGDLTEITMDAGITGDYPQIMRFVNGLERNKTFFVIRAMALTSQQGGQVSLRLRLSTWLRPADVPKGLPSTESLENQTDNQADDQANSQTENQSDNPAANQAKGGQAQPAGRKEGQQP
jgi:type IV pilus assembly protein PilO